MYCFGHARSAAPEIASEQSVLGCCHAYYQCTYNLRAFWAAFPETMAGLPSASSCAAALSCTATHATALSLVTVTQHDCIAKP